MRKSKQDWLKTGLNALGEVGEQGLTIEKLTKELGVTKGSFYHHFRGVEDFQEQLIAYWADQYLSTTPDTPDDPAELLALLDTIMEESFAAVTEPELTIRVWAQQNEMVRSFVQQVDAARQSFVLKVFRSATDDERLALLMTDMLSSMLIGSVMVLPRIPPERVLSLYQEFKRLYSL